VNITSSPGDSTLVCADSSGSGTFYIQNNAGNCLRMHDASSHYAVIEETGCQRGNTNYEYRLQPMGGSGPLVGFQNVHFKQWIGVVTCPGINGDQVVGQSGAAGSCVDWHEVHR
jgi:hypothetical protein